jgi:hypothetical protein
MAQRTASDELQLVLPTPPLPPSMKYLRPVPDKRNNEQQEMQQE